MAASAAGARPPGRRHPPGAGHQTSTTYDQELLGLLVRPSFHGDPHHFVTLHQPSPVGNLVSVGVFLHGLPASSGELELEDNAQVDLDLACPDVDRCGLQGKAVCVPSSQLGDTASHVDLGILGCGRGYGHAEGECGRTGVRDANGRLRGLLPPRGTNPRRSDPGCRDDALFGDSPYLAVQRRPGDEVGGEGDALVVTKRASTVAAVRASGAMTGA